MHIKAFFKSMISRALVSRYIILTIDLLICAVSFFIANLLRFNFRIPSYVLSAMPATVAFVLGVRLMAFFFFKSYSGIIKYTSEKDARRLFFAVFLSSSVLMLFNRHTHLLPNKIFLAVSVVVIDFVMSFFLLMSFKIGVKWMYSEIKRGIFTKKTTIGTVIFGAGRSGLITKRAIDSDNKVPLRVVAFFDDNEALHGKLLEGVRIYPLSAFDDIKAKNNVERAIITMLDISTARKQFFIDLCLELGVQAMTIPPSSRWLHGELQLNQIRNVKIEDLLERPAIVLQSKPIEDQVLGKTVLITGAAGSIGSEIVRQLAGFGPAKLILIDQAESPLVDLTLQIEEEFDYHNVEAFVANVTNFDRIDAIFGRFKPDIVYHAAAYKHVPIMERIPYEAVMVNVMGTKHIADLSLKHDVSTFVFVSTDKAVNPTNVMGASKRIAEIYIQSLNNYLEGVQTTRFITTRFGNVLGSNGSVIPRFKRQIEQGGPVTVTDPDITRYFMTIPEACQLVLEAGAMGAGGEIFIFDMGKSVRIADLANRMIRLSGKVPGVDIDVVFTGLRPGEKLKEELLAHAESTMPTHHEKIMIAQTRLYSFQEVKAEVEILIQMLHSQNDYTIVAKMKQLVPEFLSNNSAFKSLDQPQRK